ncbi:MAG: hypothetical protein JF612_12055, partial [Planctomycetia bacterium]|nr:hypothetical protein [Planctomycetia bacterium]
MSIRVTQSMLALGLVLGCVAVQTAAQERGAAKPPTTLWSVLNLPTLDRLAKPAQPKPKHQPILALDTTKSSPADLPNIDIPAVTPPESPDPESAVVSPFSSISSNRRSAIQKREMSHDAPAAAAPRLNPPPATAPPITPHWTPKFAEQTAYLQLADDGSAQPVAVNMAGDLISQRVTVDRAVAGMDPTLKV